MYIHTHIGRISRWLKASYTDFIYNVHACIHTCIPYAHIKLPMCQKVVYANGLVVRWIVIIGPMQVLRSNPSIDFLHQMILMVAAQNSRQTSLLFPCYKCVWMYVNLYFLRSVHSCRVSFLWISVTIRVVRLFVYTFDYAYPWSCIYI